MWFTSTALPKAIATTSAIGTAYNNGILNQIDRLPISMQYPIISGPQFNEFVNFGAQGFMPSGTSPAFNIPKTFGWFTGWGVNEIRANCVFR